MNSLPGYFFDGQRAYLKLKKTNCLMLFLGLMFTLSVSSQKLVYRHYTVNDGLPSSQVYMCIQDKQGYIWFSTDRGVTRFDGYSFRTFSTKLEVGRNAVFRIQEDDLGRIWCSVLNKKWFYFENDTFTEYPYNDQVDSLTQNKHIGVCYIDASNSFWCNSYNRDGANVFRIDSSGNTHFYDALKEAPAGNGINKTSGFQTFMSIAPEMKDLPLYKEEKRKIAALVLDNNPGKGSFNSKYFRRFVIFKDTILKYDPIEGISKYHLPNPTAKTLLIDSENNFWVSVPNNGAYFFKNGDLKTKPQIFLADKFVTSVLEDNEGGIWFTTLYNGVYYLSNQASKIYDTDFGLPNNYITSVLKHKSKIYCGHSSGEISVMKTNDEEDIYMHERTYKGFQHVFKLTIINKNDPVISASDTTPIRPFGFDISEGRSYLNRNDTIYKISHNGFLLVLGPMSDTILRIRTTFGLDRSLGFSKKRGLLCGTNDGLFYLKDSVFISLAVEHSFLGERVQRIVSLESGWHIIATLGKGILFWNEKELYALNTASGLNSNLANDFFLQNDSIIWACSNLGVNKICFKPEQKKIEVIGSYTIENGLISNEVNAIFIDETDLWLATREGVNQLPIASLNINSYRPPIYITKKILSDEIVSDDEVVHHSKNTLQIDFVGLSYKWPKKMKYKYRLLGAEIESWQMTSQTKLIYSALKPGNYIFEVIAINPSGISSQFPAKFPFSIEAPFWKTIWFIVTILVLLVSLLLIANYMNIRRIKKRARLLKELDEYKSQSLRSQMNPHFIYNSLNTIQSFILKNNQNHSMAYLSKFSRLMRMTFKNSSETFVSIKDDLEALHLYGELETIRYTKKLTVEFQIEIENTENFLIPPLLIQPFLENAIIHGVLPKKNHGKVIVHLKAEENVLFISVLDDGVGFVKSAEIQERKELDYRTIMRLKVKDRSKKETGISITESRIAHHNKGNKKASNQVNFKRDKQNQITTASFCVMLMKK